MPALGELKAELDDAQTLKLIASAFTEASAAKVQKIKGQFEQNAQFYEEISHLYHVVRVGAKKQEPKKETGKALAVAVTSNQRFYGNINVNVMHVFADEAERTPKDLLVIGSTGHDFLRSSRFAHPYERLSFAKEYPTREEGVAFLDRIKTYDSIMIYYPKFVTLMRQDVGSLDICQVANVKDEIKDEESNILFEPELSNVLSFFEKQVRSLLFLRVMLEADLARTAARLLTMSGAEERSNDIIKQKKSQLRKIQSSIINAKLLETFAAIRGAHKI